MDQKAFQVWKYHRIQFLAFPSGNEGSGSMHIMDENGVNYGCWSSAEAFRKKVAGLNPASDFGIGRCTLAHICQCNTE